MRHCGALLVLGFALAAGLATAAPVARSLLAVTPRDPWTLRELEREHVDLVSYDPDTGIAYVAASAAEERRLVAHGFLVATAVPDLYAGLRELGTIPGLGLYHSYAEVLAELDSLHASHPGITRLEVIGRSLEGRDIPALEITAHPELDDPHAPEVLIVGCHHAREIMSVEVPLHLARTLVEGYGKSPLLTALVDTRRVWIVPMLNPDGHVYQERTQGRPGWRKNRRVVFDDTLGVDLNRNYSYQWGIDDIGSSADPSDEIYRGAAPFSEPETQALGALVERHQFMLSLTYHSFGGLLLYPWGYTRDELSTDQPLFAALADSMVRGNLYRPGNAFLGTIYLTNGDFDDYMYGEMTLRKPVRTPSFTVELNTSEEGGFWPADSFIVPTCAALLPLNLYVLRVADNVRAGLPPPAPVVAAVQDPTDGRRIHLTWTQPEDAGNPVHHYEVFELVPTSDSLPALRPAALAGPGRAILGRGLGRPRAGEVVLRASADLEPLWDRFYVEARPSSGAGDWRPLAAGAASGAQAAGGGPGRTFTGPMSQRLLRLQLDPGMQVPFDLAIRFDPHPDSPRRGWVRVELLPAETYGELRRVIAPEVHDTRYDVLAERPGLFAYGVAAVDIQGQRSDSDLSWFLIPIVDVEVSDVDLRTGGLRIELSWRGRADTPARFEAWARPVAAGEVLLDAPGEWARGDYTLAAATDGGAASGGSLAWSASPGTYTVLLRGRDPGGPRLWGPWRAELRAATVLRPVAPNPCNPGTSLTFELARAGRVRLEIFSPDGRRQRRLIDAASPAGAQSALWDGRDDAGRALASGVYVLRLQAGAEVRTRRFVLLR